MTMIDVRLRVMNYHSCAVLIHGTTLIHGTVSISIGLTDDPN